MSSVIVKTSTTYLVGEHSRFVHIKMLNVVCTWVENWRNKPEYPEENPEAKGDVETLHTQGGGRNQNPNLGVVKQTC